MNVLNAAIVGLAIDSSIKRDASDITFIQSSTSTPNHHCVGLGIIRAIDAASKTFYILTPVDAQTLKNVNIILHGSIEIPTILLSHGFSKIAVPYTTFMEAEGQGASFMKTKHLGRKRFASSK